MLPAPRPGSGVFALLVPLLGRVVFERPAEAVRSPEQRKLTLSFNPYCKVSPTWKRRDIYVCLRKFSLRSGAFTSKYCLTNLDAVLRAASCDTSDDTPEPSGPPPQIGEWWRCTARSGDHLLKVCGMKDSGDVPRISYDLRQHMPKACFRTSDHNGEAHTISSRRSNGIVVRVPVLESAMTLNRCTSVHQWSLEDQGRFANSSRRTRPPGPVTQNVSLSATESESLASPSYKSDGSIDRDVASEEDQGRSTTTTAESPIAPAPNGSNAIENDVSIEEDLETI